MEEQNCQSVEGRVGFGAVAVIMGGYSNEREISLKTGKAVLASLKRSKINVTAFEVHHFSPLLLEQLKHFDRVFIALHGEGGEDGTLQGLLECIGVAYTGSGVLGSALAMDKVKTKQVWQACGIPTPEYWLLDKAALDYDYCFESFLSQVSSDKSLFPLFIKPVADGSSVGISKIESLRGLGDALEQGFAANQSLLVERFIAGPEYTVFLMNGKPYPVVRIESATGAYDYNAKYITGDTQYHIPSGLSQSKEQEMQVLSLKAFESIGCSGWGRADVMMDEQGQMYFLEVNTVPGLTETSLVPKSASASGLEFDQLVLEILKTARVSENRQKVIDNSVLSAEQKLLMPQG